MTDSDVGKLFVGGISRDTTDASLRDHFTQYGVVSSSIIAKDRLTGAPRGFGFVTFSEPSSVEKALNDHHVIAGRTVEVKKAIPRNQHQTNSQNQQQQQQQQQYQQQQQQQQQQQMSQIYPQGNRGLGRNSNGNYGSNNNGEQQHLKKIFVGGLSANLTEDEFKGYFEKFGRITDVVVMHDNTTNRPRGFGFITFDSEEVVEKIMQKSHHELAGKHVEVKRAVPREATRFSANGNGNSRVGGGRFSPVVGSAEEGNWVRSPGYGSYPGQVPVSGTYPYPGYFYGGVYGGAYPVGGYNVVGYGMPVAAPHSPWNGGFGVMGVRPMAYGTGYYPTGVNGGMAMMGMVHPFNGVVEHVGNGKPDQDGGGNNQVHTKDGGRLDVKKSSRVPDAQGQSKALPVTQSS